jgi:hypothetical protein
MTGVEREGSGPFGAMENLVRQYIALRKARMKGIDMKEINSRAFRGVAWAGKAASFCLGLLAMLVLIVVMTVLTAVMLIATALPITAARQKRDPRGGRDNANVSELSEPRKALAS